MSGGVTVTQADRDGAVAYWIGVVSFKQLKAIRDGENDDIWKVQELARAREASQVELVNALERIADTEADLRPGHIAYLSKADMIAIARNALAKFEGDA